MRVSTLPGQGARWAAMAALGLGMAACQQRDPSSAQQTEASSAASETPEPEASDASQDEGGKKSIIRADIEPAPTQTPSLEPLSLVIPFPAKGARPDDTGVAMLDDLIASPAFRAGGPITVWGHSDSGGSDAANLAASRRRADAVRAYLVSKGTAAERITVVAMGEARPIAPNRKLDGSDDPEGRGRNRRVEIKVDLPAPPPSDAPDAAPVAVPSG